MSYVTVEVREAQPRRFYGSQAPSSPSIGDVWIDTSNNKVYVWNGSSWKEQSWDNTDHSNVTHTASFLSKGCQPFNSNIIFSPYGSLGGSPDSHDSVQWSSGTVTLADGSTVSITAGNVTGLASGLYYFYFKTDNTMNYTTDYSLTIGDDRGLLAIVEVSSDTSQEIMIQPFYSKGLNVNADVLAANAVLADKIKAGEINTDHIRFTGYSGSDPSYEAGKLWYRSDLEQIRLATGTSLDDVYFIPKLPLTQNTSQGENLIANSDFENDRDGDGVPDYWSIAVSQFASFSVISSDSYKGGKCLKCRVTSTSGVAAVQSDLIPVKPSSQYLAQGRVKSSIDSNNDILFRVYWYQRDGSASLTPYSVVYEGNGSTSWNRKRATVTSPSDAYYARIRIGISTPISLSGGEAYTLWDEMIFSKQRVLKPSARVVAADSYQSATAVSATSGAWTTLLSYTVPDEDMELYFIYAFVSVNIVGAEPNSSMHVKLRVYDYTDNRYYPINDPSDTDQLTAWLRQPWNEGGVSFSLLLPKDIGGHTLYIQVYHDEGDTQDMSVYVTGYGISPHTHK